MLQIKISRCNEIKGFKVCFYDRSKNNTEPVMILTTQDPGMTDFVAANFNHTK